jgi:putative endonuclease
VNQAHGRSAEDEALRFLESSGCVLVERNYRCRLGEIDLVVRDGDNLVFVEVRARSGQRFGGAGASVDRHKQRRIIATARHFLMTHPRAAAWPARFDVLAFSGSDLEKPPCWIRAAFDCNG